MFEQDKFGLYENSVPNVQPELLRQFFGTVITEIQQQHLDFSFRFCYCHQAISVCAPATSSNAGVITLPLPIPGHDAVELLPACSLLPFHLLVSFLDNFLPLT